MVDPGVFPGLPLAAAGPARRSERGTEGQTALMNEWIDAEERVERAQELYDQGRWAEAAAELKAAIAVNPSNPGWYFNLALTLEAMEDFDHACEAYEQTLDLTPEDVEAMNCLGVNLTRQGKYAEALEIFGRIEKIDWMHEPSYCNRIVTYTEMGDHDKAELMFYLARQIQDECPLCYYNIGNSLFARGRYDGAIDCWRQTLRLDRSHPQANARIAEGHWAKGELARALAHFERELEIDPADVETLVDMGELLMEMGRHGQAEGRFRQAIAADANHAGAYYGLGELSLTRGKLAAAEERFRKVLSLDRSFPGAHAKLGEVLLRRGRRRGASQQFEAELRVCGDDRSGLRSLGQILLDARQSAQANAVWRKLVKLSPDDPHAQHNLGVSFFMMDRLDEGIRHCRRALKLKPDYALALYNLALAHMQRGQVVRARRYIRHAMATAPNDENIRVLSKKLGINGLWTRLRVRLTPRRKKS